jgi:hypothetical protein
MTPHPLLVQRSKMSRTIPLLSLRAIMAYERVKPTCLSKYIEIISINSIKNCYF